MVSIMNGSQLWVHILLIKNPLSETQSTYFTNVTQDTLNLWEIRKIWSKKEYI